MMLSKGIIFVALLIIPMMGVAQGNDPTDLSQYQWESRLLLMFTPTKTNVDYQQQLTKLENTEADIQDRDLKIFHLIGSEGAYVGDMKIKASEVNLLVNEYKVNPGQFTVILIGKDGTEKLREPEPISAQKLFALIDAMPMRKQEMSH